MLAIANLELTGGSTFLVRREQTGLSGLFGQRLLVQRQRPFECVQLVPRPLARCGPRRLAGADAPRPFCLPHAVDRVRVRRVPAADEELGPRANELLRRRNGERRPVGHLACGIGRSLQIETPSTALTKMLQKADLFIYFVRDKK